MDSISISNTLSKGSVFESDSFYRAYLNDASSRTGEKAASAISNEMIRKGDRILGTYEVTSEAINGGMGSVWRVYHRNWGADLAMKRPQPRLFAEGSSSQKAAFIAECENWINLGLHPNIVMCHYVREIGGVPSIFAEWMDGGSLKDRIQDGTLYSCPEQEVQERILDIALQTARGLEYSHRLGLIHQDVKPGNILLTKDWDAKVSDFGLARAKTQLSEFPEPAAVSGYTPAYCPAEQAEGEAPAPWMDIYAWALTVLEMYMGSRPWTSGAEVRGHMDGLADMCRVPVPQGVRDLLRQCTGPDSAAGPDFAAAAKALAECYRAVTGNVYPRPEARAAADSADSLNNRALSFLDLGKSAEAEALFERAEKAGGSSAVRYNGLLSRWRNGIIDDDSLLAECETLPEDGTIPERGQLAAQIHLERGDPDEAEKAAPPAFRPEIMQECERLRGEAEEPVSRVLPCLEKNMVFALENGEPVQKPVLEGTENRRETAFLEDDAVVAVSDTREWAVCYGNAGRTYGRDSEQKAYYLVRLPDGQARKIPDPASRGGAEPVFSRDGKLLAYAAAGETIRIIETSGMEAVAKIPAKRPEALCFSPDGTEIYEAPVQKCVNIRAVPSGEIIKVLGRQEWCQYIRFSPDGSRLITGGSSIAEVRDARTGCAVTMFRGHSLGRPAFSEDGARAAVCMDTPVFAAYKNPETAVVRLIPPRSFRAPGILCRVASGKATLRKLNDYEDTVMEIMEKLDSGDIRGAYEIIGDSRGRLAETNDTLLMDLRWEAGMHMHREIPVAMIRRGGISAPDVKAVLASPDSKRIIIPGTTEIRSYSMPDGKELACVRAEMPPVFGSFEACLSPDGKSIFVAGSYNKEKTNAHMYRINLETGRREADFDLVRDLGLELMRNGTFYLYNRPGALGISDDGSYLCAVLSGCIAVWDAATGKLVMKAGKPNDADAFLSGYAGKACFLDGKPVSVDFRAQQGFPDAALAVGNGYRFSPGKDAFIYQNKVTFIYGEGRFQTRTYRGLEPICFLPGGKYILAEDDRGVHVISADGQTDNLLTETGTGDPPARKYSPYWVSPDGRWMASNENDRIIIHELEWEQTFRSGDEWEPAVPFMKNFRIGRPYYNEQQRNEFIEIMRREGFGYIGEKTLFSVLAGQKPAKDRNGRLPWLTENTDRKGQARPHR